MTIMTMTLRNHFSTLIPLFFRLYGQEVEVSASMNQRLGVGIGFFQGLSNMALNCIVLGTLYLGGYLMASNEIKPGDLMAFMVSTQTVQRLEGGVCF